MTLAMLALLAATLGLFSWTARRRLLILTTGKYEVRWDDVPERVARTLKFAFGQRRLLRKWEFWSGFSHALIFGAFVTLALRTGMLVGMGLYGDFIDAHVLPLQLYIALKDTVALLALVGIAIALYRRIVVRPDRLNLSLEAIAILGWIAMLMLTDFLFDAARFALLDSTGQEIHERGFAYVGTLLYPLFKAAYTPAQLNVLQHVGFWTHVTLVLLFLNYLPYGKHFHVLTSIPNVFLSSTKPKGRLSYQNLGLQEKDPPQEDEDDMSMFGVSKVEDFSWKRMLDMYTCTECGRCTANCPATLSGKPLDPKKLILNQRDYVYDHANSLVELAQLKLKDPKAAKEYAEKMERPALIDDVVTKDVLWSCTTCRHCAEACPVFIEHVDNILDMRRYLVQAESDFPKELQRTFKGMEQNNNPWNIGSNKRADWAKGEEVKIIGELDDDKRKEVEYLFWVGCAGSYDNRNIKISKSLVKILNDADVKFAILGNEEGCSGDSARRAGNEALFQTLAMANAETINGYGVKKIVTGCPHCFNTLKNEYPDFGGNWEVEHHTDLIHKLIKDGRVKLEKPVEQEVTFHDSCYIGRYNDSYDRPREILEAIPGVKLKEMERSRELGMCCGAGGARMWMDEHSPRKVNHMRLEQAMDTEAKTLASSCPFCMTMFHDAMSAKDVKEQVTNLDVAELVVQSMRETPSGAKPTDA